MITSFEGPMGNGKTLTAVTLASLEHSKNGKTVISNTKLNFPYTHFDREWFLANLATEDGELHDCVLILDETYLYMDSSHRSKSARLFTYFVGQTRKRNVDLYVCTHHIDVIDKRIRRAVDVRGTCRYLKEDPCSKCSGTGTSKTKGGKHIVLPSNGESLPLGDEIPASVCPRCLGYGVTGWATTKFLDLRSGRRTRIRIFGPAFWNLYDTTEVVPLTAKQLKIPVEDL